MLGNAPPCSLDHSPLERRAVLAIWGFRWMNLCVSDLWSICLFIYPSSIYLHIPYLYMFVLNTWPKKKKRHILVTEPKTPCKAFGGLFACLFFEFLLLSQIFIKDLLRLRLSFMLKNTDTSLMHTPYSPFPAWLPGPSLALLFHYFYSIHLTVVVLSPLSENSMPL